MALIAVFNVRQSLAFFKTLYPIFRFVKLHKKLVGGKNSWFFTRFCHQYRPKPNIPARIQIFRNTICAALQLFYHTPPVSVVGLKLLDDGHWLSQIQGKKTDFVVGCLGRGL